MDAANLAGQPRPNRRAALSRHRRKCAICAHSRRDAIEDAFCHFESPARIAERQREKEVVKRRLLTLVDGSPAVHEHLEQTLVLFNGRPGEPQNSVQTTPLHSASNP